MPDEPEEDRPDAEKKLRMRIIQRQNFHYRYLRSICHRITGDFEKSRKDYVDIYEAFRINEGKLISKNIFGMIMMPMEKNRKKLLKLVDQFKEIIDRFLDPDEDRKIMRNYYLDFIDKSEVYVAENKHPKWHDKRIYEALKVFQSLSFFKRFKATRIREMMD